MARAGAEDIATGFYDDGMDAKELEQRLRHKLGDGHCEVITPGHFGRRNGQTIDEQFADRKREGECEGRRDRVRRALGQ